MTTEHLAPGARIRLATLAVERRHLAEAERRLDDDCASGACRHPHCGGMRRTVAATAQRIDDIDHGAAFATVLTGRAALDAGVAEGAWSVNERNEAEHIAGPAVAGS